MKAKALSIMFLAIVGVQGGVSANPVDGPKIAGHLVAYTTKAICTSAAAKPPCNAGESHMAVHGDLNTSYSLYLVVLDGDTAQGVAGAAFGIDLALV
jgi:hypothetical protein